MVGLAIRHLYSPKHLVVYASEFERVLMILFITGIVLVFATVFLWLESRGHEISWHGVEDPDSRMWVTKAVTRGGLILCILIMLF